MRTVLGSRGRGPVASAVLGGVSLAVATHCAVPTLVVPPLANFPADLRELFEPAAQG